MSVIWDNSGNIYSVRILLPVTHSGLFPKLDCGRLRGRFNNGVSAFKGVPSAAPPFGANRLRPPQPIEPWECVRDAFEFGPKSPQVAYPA